MGALHELFKRTSDAVFGIDENRNIRFWNKSCENLLGLSHQQVIGKSCAKLLRCKDLDGNSICTTECPFVKASNAHVCDSDISLVLDSGDNKPITVTVGSYYINKSCQKNNDYIHVFHSLRPVVHQ
jgi:PAS domain-containing protein